VREALTREALSQLQAALKAGGLYPPRHPTIDGIIRRLTECLEALLGEGRAVEIELGSCTLVCEGVSLADTDEEWRILFTALRDLGIEGLSFRKGLFLEEMRAVFEALISSLPGDQELLAEAWKEAEIEHVSYRERIAGGKRGLRALRVHERSMATIGELALGLRQGRMPSAPPLLRLIDDMAELVLSDQGAALALTRLPGDPDNAATHATNIALFSLAYGRYLELPPDELRRFGLGGLLHDIGEMRTSPEIRRTPGPLTAEELRLVRLHPEIGAEILKGIARIHPETRTIVFQHHVRIDGSGYPELPAGVELHPLAEAVGLLECYEALTGQRPYQRPRSPSEAAGILREMAGSSYTPELVDRVLGMLGPHPIGETVRLSTGEIAVVVDSDPDDPDATVLRLVVDATGNRLAQPERLQLGARSESPRRIVAAVDPLHKGIDLGEVFRTELGS
jgi:HD-GYP domain-containing protein (c-di-GMP phosphodiesterase class II)